METIPQEPFLKDRRLTPLTFQAIIEIGDDASMGSGFESMESGESGTQLGDGVADGNLGL